MINSDPRAENIDKGNMKVTFDQVGLLSVCVCVCAFVDVCVRYMYMYNRRWWQNVIVTCRNISVLFQVGYLFI